MGNLQHYKSVSNLMGQLDLVYYTSLVNQEANSVQIDRLRNIHLDHRLLAKRLLCISLIEGYI